MPTLKNEPGNAHLQLRSLVTSVMLGEKKFNNLAVVEILFANDFHPKSEAKIA